MESNFHVLSANGPSLRVRVHRGRKQHTKDGHGCSSCKQRHVKCDQRRPSCLRCARSHRECVYAQPSTSVQHSPSTEEPIHDANYEPASNIQSPSSGAGPLSIRQLTGSSMATIVAESNIGPVSPWIKENGTSVNQLLHHFSNNSTVIMGSTMDPRFWDLACRFNYLVSTMLAVSASHLRHVTPNPAPHRIAELGQESAAITALRPALALPLQKDSADALLCAAVMLNAVNFAFVDSLALSTSWVFSDSADRLGWLDLQLKFKKLEDATAQFRQESFLQSMLDATDGKAAGGDDAGENTVPAAWRMLVGEDRDALRYRRYHTSIQALAELRLLEPTCEGSLAYLGFLGKMDEGIRNLLLEKDPPALWMFGYWLGLLGRLDIWWCRCRVERDRAAVDYFLCEKKLGERPGAEGRMWNALIADLSTASEWPPPPSEDVL